MLPGPAVPTSQIPKFSSTHHPLPIQRPHRLLLSNTRIPSKPLAPIITSKVNSTGTILPDSFASQNPQIRGRLKSALSNLKRSSVVEINKHRLGVGSGHFQSDEVSPGNSTTSSSGTSSLGTDDVKYAQSNSGSSQTRIQTDTTNSTGNKMVRKSKIVTKPKPPILTKFS